jgi:hypothetical protein
VSASAERRSHEARRRMRLVIQRMVREGDLDEDLAAILERTLPRSL